MLRLLRERAFPATEIVPFASARSVGRDIGDGLLVRGLDNESIQGFDIALFSAGGSTSGEWAPRSPQAGAVVIDNSSAWRMDADVPLVVPEVNMDAPRRTAEGIIANPNCSTMQMVVALKPLHDAARHRAHRRLDLPGRRRARASARSRSCSTQARALLDGRRSSLRGRSPRQIAFNVLRDWKPRRGRPLRRGAQDGQRDAQDPGRPDDWRVAHDACAFRS